MYSKICTPDISMYREYISRVPSGLFKISVQNYTTVASRDTTRFYADCGLQGVERSI